MKSNLRLLWDFVRARKKWWLAPVMIFLLIISLALVLVKGSAVAPFIYALF